MILCFLTKSIVSLCDQQFSVESYPQTYNIYADEKEYLCFNSSIYRSVFVINNAPDDIYVSTCDGDSSDSDFEIDGPALFSSENTYFTSTHKNSSLTISVRSPGNVTVSTIGLDNTQCLSGIYISNTNTSFYSDSIWLSEALCYFFTLPGNQEIEMEFSTTSLDKIDYRCGVNEPILIDNKSSIVCNNEPFFSTVNTTAQDVIRNVNVTLSISSTIEPNFPINTKEIILIYQSDVTIPDSWINSPVFFALIFIITIFLILAASFVVFLVLKKKTGIGDPQPNIALPDIIIPDAAYDFQNYRGSKSTRNSRRVMHSNHSNHRQQSPIGLDRNFNKSTPLFR